MLSWPRAGPRPKCPGRGFWGQGTGWEAAREASSWEDHSLGAQQGAASPQRGERPHQRAKAENQRFWRKWLVRDGEMEGEGEKQGGGLIYPAHGYRAPSLHGLGWGPQAAGFSPSGRGVG